jgi:DNA invertase Pin-like site-specific DNA recombinase
MPAQFGQPYTSSSTGSLAGQTDGGPTRWRGPGKFLNDLHGKHTNLYLHKQGIDTTTSAGKLLFQMLGVFAEFERSMIVERVKAGLKRAKAEGKVLGRPRVSAAVEAKVVALRKQGRGMRAIARELGIGNCTVQRIVAA